MPLKALHPARFGRPRKLPLKVAPVIRIKRAPIIVHSYWLVFRRLHYVVQARSR